MSVEDDNKAFVRRFYDYINKDPLRPSMSSLRLATRITILLRPT